MKIAAALLLAATCAWQSASAQTFPSRPVTLVVPYTPNSGSDIISRIIGPRLSARWGQPVVVDNKPGASGNIGAGQVAKAAPDGHTLLMMINTYTITPALYRNMSFDPVADFSPVAKIAEANLTVAVNQAVPAQDMKSLIAWLKQNPGRIHYATPGNGTLQHLAMALFMERQGLDLVHVPYKGIGPALTDLAGGSVEVMFTTAHAVLPLVQAGKVRIIGTSGSARNALVPQVPTFREQGLDLVNGMDAWYGVLAPARTPPDLVQRLYRDFEAVITSEEVIAEARKQGLSLKAGTPAQLDALIKADIQRWQKVVNDHKITAD